MVHFKVPFGVFNLKHVSTADVTQRTATHDKESRDIWKLSSYIFKFISQYIFSCLETRMLDDVTV